MLRFPALLALIAFCLCDAEARGRHRKSRGAEKMYFIELHQDGDSIKVGDVSVVKGRAKNDKDAGPPGGEGSWYCEIQGKDGKVAWSGFVDNPFVAAHPHPPGKAGDGDDKARTGVIRLPYRAAFAKASVFNTLSGPVPIPDRSKALVGIELAQAGSD